MNEFEEVLLKGICSGRIGEIIDLTENFFEKKASELPPEMKADILCAVMCITRQDLDEIIAGHSEVTRTIKGHAFEVIFDSVMKINDIPCIEIGGDTDIDRIVNGYTLQLKTPYVNGCKANIVSYKTHKTHGAKSQTESISYYHNIKDFADFLVGLVSYEPFELLIVPKENLPRVAEHPDYIESPMYLKMADETTNNNFRQLGIAKKMNFPANLLAPEEDECLPVSSGLLHLKSDYILRAIFIKDNFRIWDMNMRGFIREHVLSNYLKSYKIRIYPTDVTGLERSDKCDLVLKGGTGAYVRFQIKGLTWKKTVLAGDNTMVDCETQLSRGRVNDHATQSRLYKATDFEYLIIAVDPPYSKTLAMNVFHEDDYSWNFYCVPMAELRKHPTYTNRVFSHQYLPFKNLQKYRMDSQWMKQWIKEI